MLKNITDSQSAGIKLIKPDVTKKFYQIASENDIFATIDLIHGQGSLENSKSPRTKPELVSMNFTMLLFLSFTHPQWFFHNANGLKEQLVPSTLRKERP